MHFLGLNHEKSTLIESLTNLVDLVASVEKKNNKSCLNSYFALNKSSNQNFLFEKDVSQLKLYNKTHVIAFYDKTKNDSVLISLKTIVNCITPILSNYTELWLDFKRYFEENININGEWNNLTSLSNNYQLVQPEIQSVLYVAAILIFFTIIFALTIICKYNTNYGDLAENNLFFSSPKSLTNSIESLNCEKKIISYERTEEAAWFRRIFSRKAKIDKEYQNDQEENNEAYDERTIFEKNTNETNLRHELCMQKNYTSDLELKVFLRKNSEKPQDFDNISINTNKTI